MSVRETGEPIVYSGGGIDKSSREARRARRKGGRVSRVASAILGLMIFAAVFGPRLVPDAGRIELRDRLIKPVGFGGTWKHPLGTDGLGRDMLAGLVAGARVSLAVGFGAAIVAALIGVPLGLIAGYRGGRADRAIGWLIDFQLAFPALMIVLMIAAYVAAGIVPLIFTIGVVSWILFARFARAFALSARESDYVAAAQLAGSSTFKIMRRHLLPNMLSPFLLLMLLQVSGAVLGEAGLSFLGLGISRPETSWGLMIADGREFLRTAWWVVVLPGAALSITILALHEISRTSGGTIGILESEA